MFEVATIEDKVRVDPEFIGGKKDEAIIKSLAFKYENKILQNKGVVLKIIGVREVTGGVLKVEDAGIFYNVKYDALISIPRIHEVIEGEVVDITDFGVFVRFGPIDGLCHISQIINDYIGLDKKTGVLATKDSNKTLKVGDIVRARIIGVSLDKKEVNKINLTMRQPGLGNLDWIELDKQKKAEDANKDGADAKKTDAKKADGKKKSK